MIRGSPAGASSRVPQVGRPHAEDDRAARAGERRALRQRHPEPGEADLPVGDLGLDDVHRRRAHERGDEEVGGLVEEPLRRVALLQDAVAEHGDALAEGHRLDLVVGDVDGRDAEALVQPRQLAPHRDAQLGVEVREGLVHEERLRLAHHRAPHRHALALAAGEEGRAAVEQRLQTEVPATSPTRLCRSCFGIRRSLSPKPRFSSTLMCG